MKRQIKTLLTLLILAMVALTLVACNSKDNKGTTATSSATTKVNEIKDSKVAESEYNRLMARENEILSSNLEVWEKVFLNANKEMAESNMSNNYGEFLLATIESAKAKFSDKEYETAKKGATEIRDIENKIAELEKKFPSLNMGMKPDDDSMSVPAEDAGMMSNSKMQKFPSFVGKDLDGNDIKSDELFKKNAVTVVNFWFTSCKPCVGELGELEELSKKLQEKGGNLIGINTFTLDGNKAEIADAKDLLAKKGVTYKNVYFDSNSEAGTFTSGIFAYPTTFVVDRNGNIVGDPIVGAITGKNQSEALNNYINQALAADKMM